VLETVTVRTAVMIVWCLALVVGCGEDNDDSCDMIHALSIYATLHIESLPDGQVAVPYQGRVHASIENDPSDDSYDYHFSIDSGHLPPGVAMRQDHRVLYLEGTPTMAGAFRFTLKVDATPPTDPGSLYNSCPDEVADKDLTITVTE
jgi:hypothetical protein